MSSTVVLKSFGKQFSKKALQSHKYQYHNESYSFNYTDPQETPKCVNIDPVNGVLACRFCHKKCKWVDVFRKHIFSKTCGINDGKSDDVSISEDDGAVHVALDIMTTASLTQEKRRREQYKA